MNIDLKNLLNALKEEIETQEEINDSFPFAPLYKQQKEQLKKIKHQICLLEKELFQEDKLF